MKIITPIKAKTRHELLRLVEKTNKKADVLEIWLDELNWLPGFAQDIHKLCPNVQLLGVCKTPDEQGAFTKDQDKKREVLIHFLENGGHFIDLDINKNELKTLKSIPTDKLWLSLHDFNRVPEDLEKLWELMSLFKPFGYKFALTPRNPLEYKSMLDFAEKKNEHSWSFSKQHIIFTTMGKQYGSSGRKEIAEKKLTWGSFYALSKDHITANGQKMLEDIE